MKKKRWMKRIASAVLTAAMVVSQIGVWNAGGTQVKAATGSWVNTTLVTNGDFETASTENDPVVGWTITAGESTCKIKQDTNAKNNQTKILNVYSENGEPFSMTQEISDVAAGTYRLAFEQEGEEQISGLTISVNDIDLTQSATTVTSFIDDFNDKGTEGWTPVWSVDSSTDNATFKATDDETAFDTAALNIYSKSAQTLTASYTISNVEAGTYAVSMKNVGKDLTATVTVYGDGVSETTKALTFGAWGDTKTNKTSSFTVSKTTDLTIKIVVDFQAGGWGWIDDVELAPSTGGTTVEDKYEVSINPAVDSVEVGNSVTLTATVTKNGEPVTNLEESGVHLYWWTTNDKQTGWLANRDENGYSFTVKVNPTEVGYCEVNAEIKDDGDSSITIDKKTIQATACTTAVTGDLNITKVADLSNDFIMGMDISSIISLFDSGVIFKDEQGKTISNVTDFCKLLAVNGITHIRVRVWNNPYDSQGNGYGGGNNDVAKAKLIADGCRAAGIKMLVDFHCSDLWTDPGKQMVPKAWTGYTLEQKKSALKDFIKDSLNQIDPNKDTVAMVQVGNETTTGFIGETSVANMCTLFSSGIEGGKEYNSEVKTVIHVTNPEKGNVTKWAKNLNENSVNYDIIATSYYPYWHGTLDNLKSEFKKVKSTYGKDVMVAETSYAYTLNDSDGHDNTVRVGNNDTGGFITEPFNEQGQATAIRNLIAAVNEVGGLGVYYWEPAWLTVGDTTGLTGEAYDQQAAANQAKWEQFGSGWASSFAAEYDAKDAGKWYGGAAVDNEAMFYPDGRPTPALHVWNYVKTGATSDSVFLNSVGKDEELNHTIKVGEQYSIPKTITVNYSNGDKTEAVVWNSGDIAKINTNKAGEYKVSGTVSLTENVTLGIHAGKTEMAVTYTLTVKEANLITDAEDAGFEKGENFTIIGKGISEIPAKDDPYEGSYSMHWSSTSATTGSVIYNTAIELSTGSYTFEAVAQGFAKDKISVQILDENDQILYKGDAQELEGWKVWKNPSVSFSLTQPTKVKLCIVVEIQNGGWGTADCLYLFATNKISDSTGGSSDNNNSGSTPSTPPADTKPDNTTETKPDGSTVETKTETKPDGTKVETVTETAIDGSKVETKKESETNTAGKQVDVATVTKTDADGKVASVVEKSTINEVAKNTTATVTVKKDSEGAVTSATASVAATIEGKKTSLSADVIAQVQEASGQKDVAVTVTAKNDEGKTLYKVKVDAKDLTADNALYIYKVDSKTGELVMVNRKTYKVDENGGLDISIKNKATYELVSKAEAKAIEKQIKATVKVQNSSKDVKKGKTTKVAFDKKMNMNNVKSITYQTADKKIATVSKSGKVTAKAKGTVTVKATVTLKNGSKKTVTMKIKVK